MITATDSARAQHQAIDSLLSRLRGRIRRYIWIEAIALTFIFFGLAFWISLAADWLVEPPSRFRLGVQIAVGLAATVLLYRTLLRRVFVPFSDKSLAVVLERRFPEFHDSLLTAVELGGGRRDAALADDAPPNEVMLAQAWQAATTQSSAVELGRVFNVQSLAQKVVAAVLLVGSIVAFALLAQPAMGIWVDRLLLLGDDPWPRRTQLAVEGFSGPVKVARGSSKQVRVVASGEVPESVEMRFDIDGTLGRENMRRDGLPTDDGVQAFSFSFGSISAPISLEIIGGDNRVRGLRIEVVENPAIAKLALHCKFPKYLDRADAVIPAAGATRLPRGTQVTVRAEANKPLKQVTLARLPAGLASLPVRRQGDRQFGIAVPSLDEDTTLLVTLHDADGIVSREPIRLTLSAVPDEPPSLSVRLRNIGAAITTQAVLPLEGEIVDDYGIKDLWFEFGVVGEEPDEEPLFIKPAGRNRIKLAGTDAAALDVQPLKLKVGQKFSVRVKGRDFFDLTETPNIGQTNLTETELEVVTTEKLISMLEARELLLRQRYETILREFRETRELLGKLAGGAPAASESSREPGDAPAKGAEPGDKTASPAVEPSAVKADPVAQRRLRLLRVMQNSQRSGEETLEIGVAFEAILDELANNRIDTPALKSRLNDQIALPLKAIARQRFPELDKRLRAVETAGARQAAAVQAATTQADLILREMESVLANMVELETFNQIVERLRGIMDLQETLTRQTSQRQKLQAIEQE